MMNKAKQWTYYLAWEMRHRERMLPIVLTVVVLAAPWIIRLAMPHTMKVRFESLVDQMPMAVLLALCWAFAAGAAAWDWNRAFSPSKAITRLGGLDVDLRAVYFAKAFAGWWSLVVLQILLTASIVGAYYADYRVSAPQMAEPVVRQGLYLAFMRSELLQLLFPFRLTRILWLLGASWLAVVAGMGLVSVLRRVHHRWMYYPWLGGALLLTGVTLAVVSSYGKQDTGGWMLVPGVAAVVLMALQFRWLKRRELE